METFKKYLPLFIILAIIIVALLAYFWKDIMKFFGIGNSTPPSSAPPAEGSPCSTTGSATMDGTIVNGVCTPQRINITKTVKIMDPNGVYALDLDSTGCLAEKNPRVLVPAGTTKPVLEVKKSSCAALLPATPFFVRTEDGWFSTEGESVQLN